MSKPVLILGAGVRGCAKDAIRYAERMNIPVCLTWGAADLMHWKHPLRVGTFGTHGNAAANLAIYHADRVIVVGSRLDTKATGYPVSGFAPNADITMVDVDWHELSKMEQLGRKVWKQCTTAEHFFDMAHPVPEASLSWLQQINAWKAEFQVVTAEHQRDPLNPYRIVDGLSDIIFENDIIVCDTGCSLAWMMQAYRFKGETFIHPFNQTPMGCALGYAVGAAFATGKKVWVVTGDGGLSLGISEMATIAKHDLDVTILLFNNRGHAMCRQTQRQWMGGEYPATNENDLATPDFNRIAKAYGVQLFEYEISELHGVDGQVKFGEPLVKEAA